MRLIKRSLLAAGGLILGGIAVLTVIAMLGVGSTDAATVEGGATATPYQTALASQLGISVDQLLAAQQSAMNESVDQSVAAGTITADQGASFKAGDFKGGKLGQHESQPRRAGRVLGRIIDSAAKTIGITPKETRTDLKAGQSLSQIAGAHNISRDQLKAGMTTDLSTQIQTALANGRITQQQATKLQGNLSTRLDKVIDRIGRRHK